MIEPAFSTRFGDGMPFFVSGPRLQEFLAEMKANVFDGRPGRWGARRLPVRIETAR